MTLALAAACGGDDSSSSSASSAAPAATTEAAASTPADTAAASSTEAPASSSDTAASDTGASSAATDAGTAPTGVVGEGLDLKGKVVKISGSETATEADGLNNSFKPLEDRTGVDVQFSGSRDFETQISLAIESGQTPDIAFFPQPGKVLDAQAKLPGIPDDIKASVVNNFDPYWAELVTSKDGKLLGVPEKFDLKSLVWYNPQQFSDNGWTVPKTWDEFTKLQDDMLAAGKTPWCIGVESGDATGWPFTDWVEDFMLRMHGPDVYDKWVKHEIPFNDPQVKDVVQAVSDIWFKEGNVLQSRGEIVTTSFSDAGLPLLDGDCMLHKQGNFYAAFLKDAGAEVGPEGTAYAFYLPPINDQFGTPVLGAGNYAVPFNTKPETLAVIAYLASPEYSNERIKVQGGGFVSANKFHDTSLYKDPIEKTFAEILVSSDPFRFDGSDLMPGAVGAGSFWKQGSDYISGATELDAMLNAIEKSWPKQ
jgi:alpha-glucoside transport system substrate-binding protein